MVSGKDGIGEAGGQEATAALMAIRFGPSCGYLLFPAAFSYPVFVVRPAAVSKRDIS
jgi:hypothetical protein